MQQQDQQQHQLQEIDGSQIEGYSDKMNKPGGEEEGRYHELSPQHLVEVEEARPEMGEGIAVEMEAREVERGG